MEFKGTSGKWVLNYQSGSWLIQDLETYQDGYKTALAEVYYFNDGKDTAEANALLISKAPEMLEMLERVLKEGVIPHLDVAELIKEATEL